MIKIKLVDKGFDRYTQERNTYILGRHYDHEAEEIEITKPEVEIGRICTMYVKADGIIIDAINIGENPVKISNVLSRHDTVQIGFSFTDETGYMKNSEYLDYAFSPAIEPEDFEPVEPDRKGKLNLLLGEAFADAEWDDENPNAINFYNIDGELRKQFEVSGGSRTQSNWAEDDPSNPAYIKNKPINTSDFANTGDDGEHPFVDSEDLAVVQGNVETLSGGLNEAQQDIQSLENRVDTAETDIENIEGSINQVADDLATETTNRTNAINELKIDSAHSLELSMNNTTYVMTAVLKNSAGTALSTQTIDFPLETLVLSVSCDSATKELVITLKNGTTTRVSVADLVSGLVPNTRKVNGKVLSSDISLTAGDVGALPDDTFIPTNTSDLNNDSGFVTESDLPTVNNATITLTQGGVNKGSFTLNQSSDTTIELEQGGGGGGETTKCIIGSTNDFSATNRLNLNDYEPREYIIFGRTGNVTDKLYLSATYNGVTSTIDSDVIYPDRGTYVNMELLHDLKTETGLTGQIICQFVLRAAGSNGTIILRTINVSLNAENKLALSMDSATLWAYMTTNSDQSISSVKTFTALPRTEVVPTEDTQLTNKAYVDNVIRSVVGDINSNLENILGV